MTARFSEASDRVSFTAEAPPAPGNGLTFVCWVRLHSDRNDFSTLMRLFGASTTLTLCTVADGVTPAAVSVGNTNGVRAGAAVLTVGDWYRVAVTVTGTTGTLYVASGQDGPVISGTGNVSGGSTTPTGLALGGRAPADATQWLDGDLAYARVWSAVLSQAEIEDEWKVASPQRTSGLWASWPLTADLTDDFGPRDLVAGSTAVDFLVNDEPPLGGPTPPVITALSATVNHSSATATVTAEDAQGLTGADYVYDWGDGSSPTVASVNTASHTYTASGLYAVLVTVTDSSGLSDSAATAIEIVVPTGGEGSRAISLHYQAIVGLLSGIPMTLYEGQVQSQPSFPYAVLFADTGTEESTRFTGESDRMDYRFQVTSVGLTAESVLVVADAVRSAVLDVRPVIAGRVCERIDHEISIPVRPDEDITLTDSGRHPMFAVDTYHFVTYDTQREP